jgi:hypothetical protein
MALQKLSLSTGTGIRAFVIGMASVLLAVWMYDFGYTKAKSKLDSIPAVSIKK